MGEDRTFTHHDTKESFFMDIPSLIFVDLDDLLKRRADRDEKASGPSQLLDQLLRDRRGSRSNVDAVVRTSRGVACGRE